MLPTPWDPLPKPFPPSSSYALDLVLLFLPQSHQTVSALQHEIRLEVELMLPLNGLALKHIRAYHLMDIQLVFSSSCCTSHTQVAQPSILRNEKLGSQIRCCEVMALPHQRVHKSIYAEGSDQDGLITIWMVPSFNNTSNSNIQLAQTLFRRENR